MINKIPQSYPGEKFRTLSPKSKDERIRTKHHLGPDQQPTINTLSQFTENVHNKLSFGNSITQDIKIGKATYDIPLATEEPSVIAAISNAAKLTNANGHIQTSSDPDNEISGQIAIPGQPDEPIEETLKRIQCLETKLIETATRLPKMERLTGRGGGFLGNLEYKTVTDDMGVIEFRLNACDSMGANTINLVAESMISTIKSKLDIEPLMGIVSNAATNRKSYAKISIDCSKLNTQTCNGHAIAKRIAQASTFAIHNENRAITHNKGIMNGVSAVALATGQDTRAIESAAHYHARNLGIDFNTNLKQYGPLATWTLENDTLTGQIALPTPVSIVGRIAEHHPTIKDNLTILNVDSSKELGEIMAATGLLSNLAALRALVTSGISSGHMALHNKALQSKENTAPT